MSTCTKGTHRILKVFYYLSVKLKTIFLSLNRLFCIHKMNYELCSSKIIISFELYITSGEDSGQTHGYISHSIAFFFWIFHILWIVNLIAFSYTPLLFWWVHVAFIEVFWMAWKLIYFYFILVLLFCFIIFFLIEGRSVRLDRGASRGGWTESLARSLHGAWGGAWAQEPEIMKQGKIKDLTTPLFSVYIFER